MQSINFEPNHFGNDWGLFIDIECANAEINYNKNKTQQNLYKITNLKVIYESSDDESSDDESSDDEPDDELFCNEVIINNNNIKKPIQKCNKISLCLITICIIIIVIII